MSRSRRTRSAIPRPPFNCPEPVRIMPRQGIRVAQYETLRPGLTDGVSDGSCSCHRSSTPKLRCDVLPVYCRRYSQLGLMPSTYTPSRAFSHVRPGSRHRVDVFDHQARTPCTASLTYGLPPITLQECRGGVIAERRLSQFDFDNCDSLSAKPLGCEFDAKFRPSTFHNLEPRAQTPASQGAWTIC